MQERWIKLSKKMTKWEHYRSLTIKAVFLHLLLTADPETGEVKFAENRLAFELGITPKGVRKSIAILEGSGEIQVLSVKEGRGGGKVAKVVNYEKFQAPTDSTSRASLGASLGEGFEASFEASLENPQTSENQDDKKPNDADVASLEASSKASLGASSGAIPLVNSNNKALSKERDNINTSARVAPAYIPAREERKRALEALQNAFVIPPKRWEEVRDAAKAQCVDMSPERCQEFIDYYAGLGWRTPSGGLVRDWRIYLKPWKAHETDRLAWKGEKKPAVNFNEIGL